jgi:hypothetical protein
LGITAGLALLIGLALYFLDPWLKSKLEKLVTEKTHGQYQLHIGALHTHLLSGTIALQHLRLRPAAPVADTLPRLQADVAHLTVAGIGLLAALRREVVPIDSLGVDSVRVAVTALPKKPTRPDTLALYQRLPFRLPGLRLKQLRFQNIKADIQDHQQPLAAFQRADLLARDLFISAAGAADTQRLGYAAAWQLRLQKVEALAGGHQLSLQKLAGATATQRLQIDSLQLRPPAHSQHGAARFRLTLPRLLLTGWRAAAWQHQHRFRADSLLLDTPDLTFWPPNKPPPAVWKMLAPLARRSDLARLRIRHGRLTFGGLRHAPVGRDMNITGSRIRVDSLAGQPGSGRILYAQSWRAHTGRLTATFSPPLYPASIEHLFLNTDQRRLRLTGLALTPTLSPAQLNVRRGYQLSTLRLRIAALLMQGVDFAALVDHHAVRIEHLTAERPQLGTASDGRGPVNPHTSVLTPEAVRKLGFRLDVRRFDIRHGTLASTYRSPTSPLVGRLSITRFNGTIFNFSNDPRRQTARTPLTGFVTAYIADRCRLEIHLSAYLLDPQGRHSGWGSFGPAPLTILNPMLTPTRAMRFESGDVRGIDFRFQADRRAISGTMQARYSNLRFQLLRMKDGQLDKSLWTRLKTGAVNAVVRDQNPRPGGRLVTGELQSRRDRRFSVFSLWRQGVVSGGLHSAGVPQKLAQKLSQAQDQGPLPAARAR